MKFVRRVKDRKKMISSRSRRQWGRLAWPTATSARNFKPSGTHDQVGHKRNHCKQEQQVNQSTGYVEHQKATSHRMSSSRAITRKDQIASTPPGLAFFGSTQQQETLNLIRRAQNGNIAKGCKLIRQS